MLQQPGKHILIPGNKFHLPDLFAGDPPEIFAIVRDGFALDPGAKPEKKSYFLSNILVVPSAQELFGTDPNPQFLKHLSFETSLQSLTGLTRSSGKFPIPAKTVLKMPLGNQDLVLSINDGATDFDL